MITKNSVIKTSETSRFLANSINLAISHEMLIDIVRAVVDDSQYKKRFEKMELIAGAEQQAINQSIALCRIWRGEEDVAKQLQYRPHKKTIDKIQNMKGDIDAFMVFLLAKYWSFLGSAATKISKDYK